MVLTVAGALWIVLSTGKTPEPALTAIPLTTYPGFESDPSFSPDGTQVAFDWDGEKRDNQDIYVKLIGTSGPPLRLTTDPAADISPAWSPDGRYIAFLSSIFPRQISGVPDTCPGGPERKLAEFSGLGPPGLPNPYLGWSPDGNSLVISAQTPRQSLMPCFCCRSTPVKRES